MNEKMKNLMSYYDQVIKDEKTKRKNVIKNKKSQMLKYKEEFLKLA